MIIRPVNVLARHGSPALQELEDLGVARVTFGSSLSQAALTRLQQALRELQETGTYGYSENTLSHADVNRLFER